jgi:hypothetical protein
MHVNMYEVHILKCKGYLRIGAKGNFQSATVLSSVVIEILHTHTLINNLYIYVFVWMLLVQTYMPSLISTKFCTQLHIHGSSHRMGSIRFRAAVFELSGKQLSKVNHRITCFVVMPRTCVLYHWKDNFFNISMLLITKLNILFLNNKFNDNK